MTCYRIIATNGDCNKIIKNNPEDYVDKLLNDEVASLYVPSNKSDACELRARFLSNDIFTLTHQQAAKEFFLKVVEYICGGGTKHPEREFSSQFINQFGRLY